MVSDADDRDVLITHAGLTAGYWRQVLGAPIDAVRAAEALNVLIGDHDAVVFRPGQMLTGRGPDLAAGPLVGRGGDGAGTGLAGRRAAVQPAARTHHAVRLG